MSRYAKAIAALCTSMALWGGTAAADGHYTAAELWGLAGVAGSTATVWAVKNAPARSRPRARKPREPSAN